MKVLVLGGSGVTGKLVVRQLIEKGIATCTLVRDGRKLDDVKSPLLTVIEGTALDLPLERLSAIVPDCSVIVSCLGHNVTLKGLFGKPRKLVTDSLKRVCSVVSASASPCRVILMNTTGNRNRAIREPYSFLDRVILGMFTLLLPPQSDNVTAARYLSETAGRNSGFEWVIVRPDTLVDEPEESGYSVYEKIQRSPVFNAPIVSRINVAAFMARLASEDSVWAEWKYRMPVVYNQQARQVCAYNEGWS